jgi:hypothetical protein
VRRARIRSGRCAPTKPPVHGGPPRGDSQRAGAGTLTANTKRWPSLFALFSCRLFPAMGPGTGESADRHAEHQSLLSTSVRVRPASPVGSLRGHQERQKARRRLRRHAVAVKLRLKRLKPDTPNRLL